MTNRQSATRGEAVLRRRLAAAVGILAVVATATDCGSPPQPPSVLLVVVDTLRADRLGLYGHHRPTTPRIDRRAVHAAVFERAYSTSSWTLPAIGSLLTGHLPATHGARAVGDDSPSTALVERGAKRFARLRADVPTLAELLAEHGYSTAAVTSNPFLDPRFGTDRGFSVYDQEPRRRAPAVTDTALARLREIGERPWFLLVHYMDPHLPYRPPTDLRGTFTHGIESEMGYAAEGVQALRRALPELSETDREFLGAAYDEEIALVDRELERLFTGLEADGRWEETLVILTSDHGEELFEHGGFEHGHALYDEVMRVPLVVWGPGVRPGRRLAPVSLTDVAPTVLEAVRHPRPPMTSGLSLWRFLADEPAVALPPRTLVAQDLLHGEDQLAAIEWPYKIILRLADGNYQLFDLAVDPGEKTSLAGDRAEKARRLVTRVEAALAGQEPLETLDLDSGTLAELRALGYVD